MIWISSGLIRAFGGIEKGTSYYIHNDFFLAKMSLFALVLLLELRPMVTLIRWWKGRSRSAIVDTRTAGSLARMSFAQAVLIVLMVCAAMAMARGYGALG